MFLLHDNSEIPLYLILWHITCAFQPTTHHLHCFSVFKRRVEQPGIFSSAAIATFSNGYKLLASCCSLGSCRAGKGARGEEPKNCLQDFSWLPVHIVPYSHPCPLLRRRDRQMVYIYLDEMV